MKVRAKADSFDEEVINDEKCDNSNADKMIFSSESRQDIKICEQLIPAVLGVDRSNVMSAAEYFITHFNTYPSLLELDGANLSIIKEFLDDGWKVTFSQTTSKCSIRSTEKNKKPLDLTRKITLVKGSVLADIKILELNNKCDVDLLFPSSMHEHVLSFVDAKCAQHFEDGTVEPSKFYILIKDEYGSLELKDFPAKIPAKFDAALSYGEDFPEVHDTIVNKMTNTESGVYIFHGPSGTGKSTYIKYLASVFPDKKFIYIPEFMVSMLNKPEIISMFIENRGAVVVIEDAEKLLSSREGNGGDLVSIVLNLSDGILSNIMQMPIILTYNTDTENIDKAILRKGRLRYKHEFGNLTKAEAIKLAKHIGVEATDDELATLCKDHMALADVVGLKDNIGDLKVKKVEKLGF